MRRNAPQGGTMTDVAEAPSTLATDDAPLTALDRCDKCGAQAFVRVRLRHGVLDFCGHHYVESELQLTAQGAEVVRDDRERINTKPSASSA